MKYEDFLTFRRKLDILPPVIESLQQIPLWRALTGRVLHLIDVENLLGGPGFDRGGAALGRRAYEAVAPRGTVNQVVIATSHHAAASAWYAWPPSARRLLRSGPDGADHALLEVVAGEDLARRFDRVVIGSGDGIFAFPAAGLQAAGCEVTVVSRAESLSRQLRLAVRDLRFIQASVSLAETGRSA